MQESIKQPADLTSMELEDLMNLEVTSVSKTEQKISHVAAAIFIITQEEYPPFEEYP